MKWIIIIAVVIVVVLYFMGKKSAPANNNQSGPVQNVPANNLPKMDPNYITVCNLLGYKPTWDVSNVGYYFISKNFCCAVDVEGIIAGGPSADGKSLGDKFLARPLNIASIDTNDSLVINDSGTDLVCVNIHLVDSDEVGHVFVPVTDLDKFGTAIDDAITVNNMFTPEELSFGSFVEG